MPKQVKKAKMPASAEKNKTQRPKKAAAPLVKGKTEEPESRTETINFRIAAADKARLRKAAAKNDRSLTRFILDALGNRIRPGRTDTPAVEKIKRSASGRKDDKVLLLIPSAAKMRLRRSAKKADLNLSQYILDTLFE